MKRAAAIVLCLAGMTAGLVAGRMIALNPAAEAGAVSAADRTEAQAKERPTNAKPGTAIERKHDLGALAKWQSQQNLPLIPGIQRELERMSAPALRNLIVEMTAIFSDSTHPDVKGARQIIIQASVELFRREGEAALEWASTVNGDRELMLRWMLGDAAAASPDLAMRWVGKMENAEGFHKEWWRGVVYYALAGAMERGADDLIRFHESYGSRIPENSFTAASFPNGFEYEKVFTSLGGKMSLGRMVQFWSATDRDAAWKSVKEMIDAGGKGANYAGSLFAGTAAVEGGESAAKWLVPKLGELPEAARVEAIQSLCRGGIYSENLGFVIAAISRESDRITVAKSLVSVSTSGGEDLVALRGLSSDAARSEVLIAAANQHGAAIVKAQPRHVKAVRDYFRKTMASLETTEDVQAQVMEILEAR